VATRVQQSIAASASNYRKAAVTGCIVLCGLARLWYLTSSKVQFNADEATTGVMARQIMHGHMYVFFPGQDYGGSLEAYLQAGTYLIFRLPQNPLTLRLVLVALSMATCAMVYLVGSQVLPSPIHATIAALIYALSPWYNVIGSVTSLGFYIAGQLTAVTAIYCALRCADSSDNNVRWPLLAGLCCGLAAWTTAASIYFLVPIVFWIIPSVRSSWSRIGWSVVGAVLGALPLVGWFVIHRQLPIPPKAVESSSVSQRLANLFGPVLREYVGVTYAHADGGLPFALQVIVVAALLGALALALWLRRGGLLAIVSLRTAGRLPGDLLLAVPIVVIAAYAASDSTWYTGTPRYLMTTYPLFAIGIAALLSRLRVMPVVTCGAIIVVAMALVSWGSFRGLGTSPSTAEREKVMSQVADYLDAQHETYVYGDYWTAIPLQYVAGAKLKVAVCVGAKRFPQTQAAVAAHTSPVYISSILDGSSDPIRTALNAHGIKYHEVTIGFVTVYDQIPGNVQPATIGL
jgi:hypothetical protein